MRTVTCYCENIIETDLPESIDLEKNPEYYKQITSGTFQNITCEKCGILLKPELQVHLKDISRGLDLLFIPESERSDFFNGKVPCEAGRLAIGYPELVEKIELLKADLNDGAVEILKYFLKKKTGSEDALVHFNRIEDDQLVFHILGLKEGQVAVSRLPRKVYLDTVSSFFQKKDEELFKTILEGPYVSANKISIQEDE